jgi:hypothetical protein
MRGIFLLMNGQHQQCPFFSPEAAVCTASFSSRIPPLTIRKSCCTGEDCENCPTFLARLLTSLRRRKR